MKKYTLLFFMVMAAMPWTAIAQSPGAGIILVGDTSNMDLSSYNHLPYDPYSSSYTQQLVLHSELGGAAMITGIDLYCGSADANGRPGTTLYLANTYADKLQGGMVPFGLNFSQVMVDSLVCTTGWNHYDFDTPFYYNGLGNLVVAFDSPFSGWMYSGGQFYCSFRQDMSRYAATPLAYLTPNHSTSLVHYRNVMRLHTQPAPSSPGTCPPPTLHIDSVGATAIGLSWSPGYQDTSWTVAALTDGDTAWLSSGLLRGDTTYTLSGLQPNTHYTLRLTAYCTDTFTSVLRHVLTNCTPALLPYGEYFDSTWSVPSCWLTTEGWNGNYPVVSSSYSHSGGHSLHLYGGSVVLPAFDAPADSLELSFWARNGSVNSSLNLFVGMVTDPLDMNTFVPVDTLVLARTAGWTPAVVRFDNYSRPSGRIAIRSSISYIYIDDIEVNRSSLCHTITDVDVDQVTDTGAVVHWGDSGAVYYDVAYGPTGFVIDSAHTVTDIRTDSLQLTGLLPYTQYDVYVRPYCGSTPPNWSLVRTFRTLCGLLDSLPYIEDFDAYGTMTYPNDLPCWSGQVEMNTCVVNVAAGSHSGNRALRWDWSYADRVTNQRAILPLINTTANPINTLQVSFWAKNEMDLYNRYENAKMLVGVMSDPDNDSTFQLVDTVLITTDDWRRYDVPLSSYSGAGGYITLKSCPLPGSYSQWRAYFDDLTIEELRSCPNVNDMAVAGLTATSVTLTWSHAEADTATRWQTYIDTLATATPQADSMVVSAPTHTFGGLTAGITYYTWVRALCSKGDTSEWEGPMAVMPGSWNMRPYRHDTLSVCGISLYDDGGATGNFSRQNSSLVLLPSEPGTLVSVSGNIYINNISSLTIYDSIGTSGRVLWSRANEIYPATFGPIISESGPITLVFNAMTASYATEGFELDIACVPDSCILKRLRLDPTMPPSTNQVSITWDCNGASLYQVEYGPVGFVQGTGTTDSTNSNSYTIGGLRSMEHLDFYVRCICGEGDTGDWVHGSFSTIPCPDAVYRENFDSTLIPHNGVQMFPIGQNSIQYSYVQTIVDSAHLVGLEGGITALAFHPSTFSEADHMSHITVYLANVAEGDLSTGPILPDGGHRFVKVIDSANFYHNLTDEWQMHSFDRPFMWDGHQNLLVAVVRNDGGTGKATAYYGHYPNSPNPQRGYFIYSYDEPINIDSANTYTGSYSTPVVGDLRLYTNTCDLPLCANPTVDSVGTDYERVTVAWSGSGYTYQLTITPDDNGLGTVYTDGTSHTFSILQPGTSYRIALRQNCTADSLGYSEWVEVTATTDTFACAAPENVTVGDITHNSALLDWDASGSDSIWQLDVWVIGNRHSSIVTTTHPYLVENLSPGTQYAAYVHAYCGEASQIAGIWSDTVFFDTPTCPDVSGLDTAEVGSTSLLLQWEAEPLAQQYLLEYGLAGFALGSGTEVSVEGNSYRVSDLVAGRAYDFYVRTRCAEDWEAANYTSLRNVTTRQPVGIERHNERENLLTLVLMPNPARESTTVYLQRLSGRIVVSLSDLSGREVLTREVDCDGSCRVVLDIADLPQGAYFVRISSGKESLVRKLIIR